MSDVGSGSRERVLSAIRGALRDVPPGEPAAWSVTDDLDPAAAYARELALDAEARTALFVQRCGEYRATVTRSAIDPVAVGAVVAEVCARQGVESLAVAADVPDAWRPAGVDVRADDPPLSASALDGVGGALTGAAGAIAITGTIVLDGSPRCGRRALTLVPDLHVCVVAAAAIVAGVPEAVQAFGAAIADRRAPVTLVSGPSATSDIELRRVEGVHGPRRLEVIVAG